MINGLLRCAEVLFPPPATAVVLAERGVQGQRDRHTALLSSNDRASQTPPRTEPASSNSSKQSLAIFSNSRDSRGSREGDDEQFHLASLRNENQRSNSFVSSFEIFDRKSLDLSNTKVSLDNPQKDSENTKVDPSSLFQSTITTRKVGEPAKPKEEIVKEKVRLSRETFQDLIDFITSMCASLIKYGMPMHRVEYQTSCLANRFGLDGTFAAFPGYFNITLSRKNDNKVYTYNLAQTVSYNLEKLEAVDVVIANVANKKMSIREGVSNIKAIHECPPSYGRVYFFAAMVVMGFTCAKALFNSGLYEMIAGAFLTFILMLYIPVNEHSSSLAKLSEPLWCTIVSFLSCCINKYIIPVDYATLTIIAVVWFLPGLQINIAAYDLSMKHAVSGTARFIFAIFIVVEIAFGVAFGNMLCEFLPSVESPLLRVTISPTLNNLHNVSLEMVSSPLPKFSCVHTTNNMTQLPSVSVLLPGVRYSSLMKNAQNSWTSEEEIISSRIGLVLPKSVVNQKSVEEYQMISRALELIWLKEEQSSDFLKASGQVAVPLVKISDWWNLLLVPICFYAFGISMNACGWQQHLIICIASSFGFCSAYLYPYIGMELATVVGQCFITLTANIYARKFNRPGFVPVSVASFMLMPSSIGVRGVVSSLLTGDFSDAIRLISTIIITATSMVVGAFIGNAIISPSEFY